MKITKPAFPVADGCKLILATEFIDDIESALALAGLGVVVSGDATDPETDVEDGETEEQLFEQDLTLDSDLPININEGDDSGRSDHFFGLGDEMATSAELDRYPSTQFPFLRSERSMIAYTLVPDERDTDNVAPHSTVPNYHPVPSGIQSVSRKAISPDAEVWRVAKQVLDSGPVSARPGKVDLRGCVERIAKAELLPSIPRKTAFQRVRIVEILVDLKTAEGAFSSDVNQLERALRSTVNVQTLESLEIACSSGVWFRGSGPIWTFDAFVPAKAATWYIVIAGGSAFDENNIRPIEDLARLAGLRHSVTVVWLGDNVRPGVSTSQISWVSFRR